MATRQDPRQAGPTLNTVRVVFLVTAIAAAICGYVGLAHYLRDHPPAGHGVLDIVYYDLQLFTLNAGILDQGPPYPLTLQVARLAAPIVTLYAVFEAARLLLAGEIRRIRAAHARGHTVICGHGPVSSTLAQRLRAAGQQVVMVAADPPDDPGILQVTGDARDPRVLRAAGLRRARVLYSCADDSAVNVTVATAARSLGGRGPAGRPASRGRTVREPLRVYAHISEPDLCGALRARRLARSGPPGGRDLRLDFFTVDELAAQVLAASEVDTFTSTPPTVMIIGLSIFGRALLVDLARRWRLRNAAEPLPLIVIDPAAKATVAALSRRYEFLAKVCAISCRDIAPVSGELNELLGGPDPLLSPDRVYICDDHETVALTLALTSLRLWSGRAQSLVVRMDGQAALGAAFGNEQTRLFDELAGSLRLFGVADAACKPDLIGTDLVEQLARAFHEDYVLARTRHGDSIQTNPSMVGWAELPESLKRANRAAAGGIGDKLAAIDCILAPRVDPRIPFAFGHDEVERLAIMEHQRWTIDHLQDGWTYGPVRDNDKKVHPDLQTWDRLPEPVREKDRDAVRALPAALAAAGFQIVRLGAAQAPAAR
jgi:voltage-gated potassium channel Kch